MASLGTFDQIENKVLILYHYFTHVPLVRCFFFFMEKDRHNKY